MSSRIETLLLKESKETQKEHTLERDFIIPKGVIVPRLINNTYTGLSVVGRKEVFPDISNDFQKLGFQMAEVTTRTRSGESDFTRNGPLTQNG